MGEEYTIAEVLRVLAEVAQGGPEDTLPGMFWVKLPVDAMLAHAQYLEDEARLSERGKGNDAANH